MCLSDICTQVSLYISQQHNGYSVELMRIAFSNRNPRQHNFKCNSQQKHHAQLYMDAVYHMDDMWMVSVIRPQCR